MSSTLITFLDQSLKPPLQRQQYNIAIEQYRGLCALLVLAAHGTVHTDLLVNNFKWPEYVWYFNSGYLSVLVFFCISGYVIGLTNDKQQLKIKPYLKQRLIRLYPIYIIAIILCMIVARGASLLTVTGNLLFLQNDSEYGFFKIPVFVNYASWSLNYEVVYYLLFIPLFLFRPKLWKLFLTLIILSLALMYCNERLIFLANYITGFFFWGLGLCLVWNVFKTDISEVAPLPLLSMAMLHLCQNHLGLGNIILHVLGIFPHTNINWLFDLPFCLMIMAILTCKESSFLRLNKLVCYLLPALIFVYLGANRRLFENIRWPICMGFWLLSLLFYWERRISSFLMNKLTFVGSISYGLYLLHIPVAYLIKTTIFIKDQRTEILLKYTLWISLTFILSYVLERKLQPAIKQYLINI